MKKKLLLISCMVALFVCLLAISVSAIEVEIDEIIYTLTADEATGSYTACVGSNTTATNKAQTYTNTEITIPAYVEYEGKSYKVTDINFTAFEESKLTKITFDPDCEIEIIREYTFKNCKSLTTVVLPSKLKIIAGAAFTQCDKLTALYLPETLERIGGLLTPGATLGSGNDAKINAGTFLGCTNLYFVNNLGDTEKPDVWYAPAALKELYGEGIKQLKNVNSVMVFGENLNFVDDGYFFADKGAQRLTLIFKGDFTQEGSKFEVTCENVNNKFYFTHPNVTDNSFLSYDDSWRDYRPTSNFYFCAGNKAYTMSGTVNKQNVVYTEIDFAHIVGETVTTAATCTENSYKIEKCYCGAEISNVKLQDALGHSYNSVVTEPDCLNGGYTTYTCSVCGDTYVDDEVDALGHSMSGWILTTAPVYGEAGEETNKCANCDYAETRAYNAEAKIGDAYYATFEEAYVAVKAGETIALLAPITVTSDMTLNIEGITIESAGDVFVVTGGTLIVEGNGVVKAGKAGVGSWCAVWANGGTVVINGGTYSVGGDSSSDPLHQNDLIYTKNGGKVTINGGTFIAGEGIWALNENDANRGTITVNGGKFVGFNPANNVSEGEGTNFVADGYAVVANGTEFTVAQAAAKIGDVYYATFAEAYAAVKAGETITLLTPITVTSDMTLNIEGITIESAGDVFVVTGGTLIVEGNGVVNAGTAGVGSWCAVWANGGTVVINGGTYSVGGDSSSDPLHQNDLIYTKNGGKVTINGGTFIAGEGIWALNENDANRGTITVNGGKFVGFNPANNVSEGEGTNFVADGYHAQKSDNVYTVAPHSFVLNDIVYENGFGSEGVKTYKCDGCEATKTEAAESLFKSSGYSVPENGVAGITVGYSVNAAAIKEYTELTGSTLNYGVFAVLKDNVQGDAVIDENGAPLAGVISKEITEYALSSYNLKIVGFETEKHKTAKLAMGTYVIEANSVGKSVSYVQAVAPIAGESFTYVAYSDLVASKEDN